MRTLLFSAVSFFVASTVAVAAPASKPAASASFAAHQTVTEKQATGLYDLSGLPQFTGKVAQFLPAPHGGVLGVVLTDGTQVLVSPDQGHTVAGLIKPGDTVSIQGLKARSLPLIRAFSLTSPRGRSMQDSFIVMPQQSPEMITGPDLVLHGDIWMPLYDLNGQVSGVILKDHTVIYLAPREATRLAAWLKAGQNIYAVGTGTSGELGIAIDAREIGPTAAQMVGVAVGNAPAPGPAPGSAGYDIIPGSE
ncbi:hypothetical protein HK15_08120 [Acetobacter orientalis]|uniref:Uncharacterized protein n=1 Tax=Acetobacter orientalis TaxID=146474 RepID=A0A252BAP8_9PROT|nr:hypothetical protein [Acetobacter orientalis]OUJ01432.1 hypothetical protein HK15_08120 [Acetobacter orientalis]